MRIVKEAEERRNEIIEAANRLFSEKGYDNTSVVDIMNAVGIAKGTLYYHFKSKEDIMNAMIEHVTGKLLEAANAVAENPKLSVHEKILQAIMALNMDGEEGKVVLQEIHNPQNALMHQKQLEQSIRQITPILTKIVQEGIEQGIFQTPYPYESVEMIIIYMQIAFDQQAELKAEEGERKIKAFICNLERITGAEEGSFSYIKQLFERNNH